jgi:tRNA 2-thiouridine synthesizing protein A
MSTIIITVDAKGQSCPGPLVSLAKAIKNAPQGATFELLATDPGSKSDVPSWAELSGNVLESAETLPDGSFRYLITRAAV